MISIQNEDIECNDCVRAVTDFISRALIMCTVIYVQVVQVYLVS